MKLRYTPDEHNISWAGSCVSRSLCIFTLFIVGHGERRNSHKLIFSARVSATDQRLDDLPRPRGAVIPQGASGRQREKIGCSVSFDCVYRRRHANASSIDTRCQLTVLRHYDVKSNQTLYPKPSV